MTIRAFADGNDGYYQIDITDGEPIPNWLAGMTEVPVVPPPDPVVVIPDPITDWQFFQQLANMELITKQEALDAVGPGIIPASMDALIEQLPEDRKFPARMVVSGATWFHRYSPLVSLLGSLYGLSDAQIDKLWTDASKL